MPVSAEGRVENQKLIQTTALLLFGWVFGFQLDLLEKTWSLLRDLPVLKTISVMYNTEDFKVLKVDELFRNFRNLNKFNAIIMLKFNFGAIHILRDTLHG